MNEVVPKSNSQYQLSIPPTELPTNWVSIIPVGEKHTVSHVKWAVMPVTTLIILGSGFEIHPWSSVTVKVTVCVPASVYV